MVFAFGDPVAAGEYFSNFVFFFMLSNLVLGLFNLLPIPPLDGGRIVVGLLPEGLAMAWARLERAGIVVVLLLVFLLPQALREFGIAFDPVGAALGWLLPAGFRLVLMAAGHPGDV
jgi:Zn-dependent protease